jgi:uncharacterized protein with GYD domain
MALYMTQFSYTAEAWASLARNPVDRGPAINALFEKVGGRLLGLYYCLGEYDGLVLAEAPDDTAVTAALIAVVGAGHIKSIKTTRLLSADDMMAALKKSSSLGYGAPQ